MFKRIRNKTNTNNDDNNNDNTFYDEESGRRDNDNDNDNDNDDDDDDDDRKMMKNNTRSTKVPQLFNNHVHALQRRVVKRLIVCILLLSIISVSISFMNNNSNENNNIISNRFDSGRFRNAEMLKMNMRARKSITTASASDLKEETASSSSSSSFKKETKRQRIKTTTNGNTLIPKPKKSQAERRKERRFGQQMIPKIIHQTYKSEDSISDELKKLSETWKSMNPGYEYKFYDDNACDDFVKREFPEYYDAYAKLPKNVERSDFFRILVVLRKGGVYADMDAGCVKPIDTFIMPTDSLVVGWENECATDERAYSRHFARRRQITNWVFASAPGHPALRAMAEHIKTYANAEFMNNTNRNTLEKTGPGAFTDNIMRSYWEDYDDADNNNQWSIKILPRVAFGTHPSETDTLDGLSQKDERNVLVAHYFLGSWKNDWGAFGRDGVMNKINLMKNSVQGTLTEYRESLVNLDPNFKKMQHQDEDSEYPVTALFDPPFEAIVGGLQPSSNDIFNRSDIGNGFFLDDFMHDDFSVSSMSAQLTIRGEYQAGVSLRIHSSPTSADAIYNMLEGKLPLHAALPSFEREPAEDERGFLIDVGSNVGYFALAAAARGHKVLAFTSLSTNVLIPEMFKSAIARNQFGDLIKVVDDFYPSFEDAKTSCSNLATSDVERDRCEKTLFTSVDDIIFHHERENIKTLLDLNKTQKRRVAMRISATRRIARALAGSMRLFSDPILQLNAILIELAGGCNAKDDDGRSERGENVLSGDASNLETMLFLHSKLGYTGVWHAGPICDSYGSEGIKNVLKNGSNGMWCEVHELESAFKDITELLKDDGSVENVLFTRT
jgi:mannosyltransferase OCH1-like enzyme